MKRWLLVFCAFLCAGSFVSCGVQRYRVDSASRVVDTAGTFRNDRLGLSFYFSKFYTQHGSCPLDRAAARMLAACEIDPKTDTVLFGGGMMFCVLRYSRPSYLNETKKHPLSWEHHRNCSVYPLLDTVQNRPSGFVAEQKCLFSNENLRKYCTPEEIELDDFVVYPQSESLQTRQNGADRRPDSLEGMCRFDDLCPENVER